MLYSMFLTCFHHTVALNEVQQHGFVNNQTGRGLAASGRVLDSTLSTASKHTYTNSSNPTMKEFDMDNGSTGPCQQNSLKQHSL